MTDYVDRAASRTTGRESTWAGGASARKHCRNESGLAEMDLKRELGSLLSMNRWDARIARLSPSLRGEDARGKHSAIFSPLSAFATQGRTFWGPVPLVSASPESRNLVL